MNCRNCGQPIEVVNYAGRYWRHLGRPGGIGAAWCDENATIVGPRAEPSILAPPTDPKPNAEEEKA